jgi:hypothetical protein
MSDVSSSASPPPASGAARVAPTPVSAGQSGQQQSAPHGGGSQPAAPHAPLPHDTAVTLSPSLAGYTEGDQIAVEVLARDAAGRQVLQAANAIFVTLEAESFPDNAELLLRVAALGSDHLRVAVLAVDGEEPPVAHHTALRLVQVSFDAPDARQAAAARPRPDAVPLPAAKDAPAVLRIDSVVRAQVLTAAANDAAPAEKVLPVPALATTAAIAGHPQNAVLPAGTIVQVRILSAQPPTAVSTAPTQAAPSAARIEASASPRLSAPPAPGAATGHQAAPLNASQAPLAQSPIRVAGILVPGPRPDQSAVVTPSGTLVLPAAVSRDWPEGTRLALEIVSDHSPLHVSSSTLLATPALPAGAAPKETTEQFLLRLGDGWPALRDMVTTASIAAPAATQAFVQQQVPTPNSARAAAQILFFLSVLRSGDVAGWLGNDVVRVLERTGQRGLIDRLGDDFRQLRRVGEESGATGWRLLLFPFAEGERVEPVRMFVRGQRRNRDDSDHDLRFVVDLRLSALGELQFDGLLHGRTFDLIVRSHEPLDDRRRRDIGEIFTAGLETIGFRGALSFQTVREFPVQPFNDLLGIKHRPGAVLA